MKVGTRLFDIRFGWGESFNNDNGFYPIGVNLNGIKPAYRTDGEAGDGHKWLSLTEYNLTTGGFTAIDSEPPLEVGDMAYGWDDEATNLLVYGKVTSISSAGISFNPGRWKYASKEIPQWFIDKNK